MKHGCSDTCTSHTVPSGRSFLSSHTFLTCRGSQNCLQGNPVVPTILPFSLSLLALCVGSINQGEVRVPRGLGTYHQQGGREADGRGMDCLASGQQRRCKNRIAGQARQTEPRDRPLLEKYWPAVSTHFSDSTSQALPVTL